jgi:hypothetical protein
MRARRREEERMMSGSFMSISVGIDLRALTRVDAKISSPQK